MRISLVRHGQSEANVGNYDYTATGDHQVPLTEQGHHQAERAGEQLYGTLRRAHDGRTLIYCSPYTRTRQTLQSMLRGASIREDDNPRIYEDARLRETDHGYSDVKDQQELRNIHGWFYYRYAGGESPADCFDRASTFMESLMRQVERKKPEEVVIVAHGLLLRCFIMRFMHLTVEQFELLANPGNCDIMTIAPHAYLASPVFTSGKWGVEGIKLREMKPEPAKTRLPSPNGRGNEDLELPEGAASLGLTLTRDRC